MYYLGGARGRPSFLCLTLLIQVVVIGWCRLYRGLITPNFRRPNSKGTSRSRQEKRFTHQKFSTMTPLRKQMISWMECKNYSASTVKCYVRAVSMLGRYYGKCPSKLTKEEVAAYLNYVTKERGYSYGSISGAHSGIKLFWKQILDREWNTKVRL